MRRGLGYIEGWKSQKLWMGVELEKRRGQIKLLNQPTRVYVNGLDTLLLFNVQLECNARVGPLAACRFLEGDEEKGENVNRTV